MRPLPFTCLGAARTWGTQPRQPPASSPASGVVARPGAAPAAPATCALSHLRQVWWYAQGRFRPRQPPAPSPISGLLGSVLTPGSGGGGGESAVAAAKGYYHFKLNHVQVSVPAPPFCGTYGGHRRIMTVELSN
ncbi:unnamed protein product [Schistocephalus solidus]|uniref:Secreted protein n=1 Tax=Schistocephalus solidus TaxID=70667 RepID=A0A183SBN2_SCHSO|nr:unnamed protein product [Schistocephalus solidus]